MQAVCAPELACYERAWLDTGSNDAIRCLWLERVGGSIAWTRGRNIGIPQTHYPVKELNQQIVQSVTFLNEPHLTELG